MGLLAHVLMPSGLTHGRPPCFFLPSPGDMVPMVPNLVSISQNLWDTLMAKFELRRDHNTGLVKSRTLSNLGLP
jgi:hypothetical protein